MTDLLMDARYALRVLRKNPAFAIGIVATLAVGIGANAAIFSVMNSVIFEPLNYREPDRIVALFTDSPHDGFTRGPLSYPDLHDWQQQAHSFENIAGLRTLVVSMRTPSGPERIAAARVSSTLPSILGLQPVAGRAFTPDEDQLGREHVALIGQSLWQRRFGSSSSVVGTALFLDDQSYEIVGVLPAESLPPQMMYPAMTPEVWIPLAPTASEQNRGFQFIRPMARIKAGATLPQAEAEVNALNARIEAANPGIHKGWRIHAIPLQEVIVGNIRPAMLILFATVGCVLLIACVNIASLLLARSVRRKSELAVRSALGANRRRLLRQLLTESGCLSLLGGCASLLVTAGTLRAVIRAVESFVPRVGQAKLDAKVLVFTLAISLACGLLFGIAPLFQGTNVSLIESLRQRSNAGLTRASTWAFRSLVVAQTALALVLLLASGLLMRSFLRLSNVSPGFSPEGLMATQVDLALSRYSGPDRQGEFYTAAVRRIREAPAIHSAAAVSRVPMLGGNQSTFYQADSQILPPEDWPGADARLASPGYFATMKIPMLKGRDFSDEDRRDTPHVMIINREMADRLWRKENPIGRRIQMFPEKDWRTVIGVGGDVKLLGLDNDTGPTLYIPYRQNPFPTAARTSFIVVRSDMTPDNASAVLRRELASIDDGQAISQVHVLSQVISDSLALRRFTTVLTAIFAAMSLGLALLGIYGVMAFFVNVRIPDIGVRAALGARRGQILWWILRQGLGLTAGGIIVGLISSVAAIRLLSHSLFQVTATDPLTYVFICVVMLCVATSACYLPARRAAGVPPIAALRD